MKRILLLAAALPCAAIAQTQFQPPGGLPLSTQVGTSKNTDGTASVTLGTMQDGIETNGSNIAALQASSVSHGDLSTALAAYQPQAAADGKYATQTALSDEVTRAQNAEQANSEDIAAIRSGYVTTGALNSALGAYVTGSALSSALAPYLTQSQAAATYLPLSGGNVQTLAVGTTFIPPVTTYAQATASQCVEGTLVYVRDAQKFGSSAPAGGAAQSPIYSYTGGATWGGALYLCTRLGGTPAWVGLTFNQNNGPA